MRTGKQMLDRARYAVAGIGGRSQSVGGLRRPLCSLSAERGPDWEYSFREAVIDLRQNQGLSCGAVI